MKTTYNTIILIFLEVKVVDDTDGEVDNSYFVKQYIKDILSNKSIVIYKNR